MISRHHVFKRLTRSGFLQLEALNNQLVVEHRIKEGAERILNVAGTTMDVSYLIFVRRLSLTMSTRTLLGEMWNLS